MFGQPLRDQAYVVVLFFHLLAVVTAFGATALLHVTLGRLRRAERTGDVRREVGFAARVAMTMPVWALLLLATGATLTQLRWSWHAPWIATAIGSLVAMVLIGPIFIKPRVREIVRRAGAAGDGPVDAELAAALRDPVLYTAAQVPAALAVGILFLMATKPLLGGALATVLVAVILALAGSVPAWRAVTAAVALDAAPE